MIKKTFITLVLILAYFSMLAQEELKIERRNELKLNIGYLIVDNLEVSYEKVLKKDQGLGVSVSFYLGEIRAGDNVDFIDFLILPYYRVYFGKKIASGFFIEGNAAFFHNEFSKGFNFNEQTQETEELFDTEQGFGLGFAIGGKFLSQSNWIGEIYGGLGRNLLIEDDLDSLKVYPRIGLTIGKRF